MSERTVYETDHAANVAKLQQLANDAREKAVEFTQIKRHSSASYYSGMSDGLLRAISVLEGRG